MMRQRLHEIKSTLDRILEATHRTISVVLQWIVLPLVYLFLFVPYRILFRRGKRDLLARRIDTAAISYWHDVREAPEREKQF